MDRDGILNTQEKKEWIKQLKEGYENQLYWDPINTNSNNGYRVVQKGGKILTDIGEFGKENEILNQDGMTFTKLKQKRNRM